MADHIRVRPDGSCERKIKSGQEVKKKIKAL